MTEQITTADELDALPTGSQVRAHWPDGSQPDYYAVRTDTAGGAAGYGQWGLLGTANWLGMAKWKAALTVLYDPAAQPTEATRPTVEQVADVFAIHRWKSMGVASVSCECGEILYGDESLTQFPADEAFREHLARAVMALYASAPTASQVKAEALREAADEWSDWDALSVPEDWLRGRADRIEAAAKGGE